MIGRIQSQSGFGPQDHLCWVDGAPGNYGAHEDYRPRLFKFFSEGLRRGLRVAYVGSGGIEELRERVDGVMRVGSSWRSDAVRIISFDEICRAGEPIDPAQVVSRYAEETQEALTDGYRGLRISADVSGLLGTPEQQDAFARSEFLLERYSSRHPLSAMCEYRVELGDVVKQFACMHAAVPDGLTPFQIFACDDGAVGFLGEFDIASEIAFGRALQCIQPAPGDSRLIFDMSAVGFMDHHALLALNSYAQVCRIPVFVRSMPPVVRRVARMLDLEHLGHVRQGDPR